MACADASAARLVVGSSAAIVFLLLILALSHALYGSAAWAYDFSAYHHAVLRLIATGSPYQPGWTLNEGPFQAGPFDLTSTRRCRSC